MSESATLQPPRDRLSDAPKACRAPAESGSAFWGGVVQPDDLSVVFHPIVRLDSGNRFAYEALVRCRVAGFTPPALFERALAERSTGRLGRAIREIAVPKCSGIPLFLNLHPSELEEGWLLRSDDPIASHDHEIYLEITETTPLTHTHVNVLREVRSRVGAHVVVDDFGAGYSNFKHISDLEPRVVKLDRSLIEGLDRKRRQQRLVAATVRLCHELGALVVAEGIETPDEYAAVRDCGAQYGQGYLFARPTFPLPRVEWPPRAQSETRATTRPAPSVRHRLAGA